MPAIRSDSLWRSSPAPRIVVVPLARGRGQTEDRGSRRSRRRRLRARDRSPWSADERTRRSTIGSPASSGAASVALGASPTRVSSMSAPIVRSRSITARRVGFAPTPRSVRSASGWMAAATSQNAAADTSPGTRSSIACTVRPPSIVIATAPSARPDASSSSRSVRTAIPRARSIRSVWSRVATASRTVVEPSARSPASRIADLTWALGTGVRRSTAQRADDDRRWSVAGGCRRPGRGRSHPSPEAVR